MKYAKFIWFYATGDFTAARMRKYYRDSLLVLLEQIKDWVVSTLTILAGIPMILTWPLWKPIFTVLVALRHKELAWQVYREHYNPHETH